MRTFAKCDFHIHSSSDFSRSYSEDDFLESLVSSGLDYIAITDHNGIDVGLNQRVQKQLAGEGIGVLAGVELNLKLSQATVDEYGLYVATKQGKNYFHAIVLASFDDIAVFAEKVNKLFVDAGILSAGDFAAFKSGALSRQELSKLTDGKAIELEKLQDSLQSIPHFLIPHECKGSRNLSGYLPINCPTKAQANANKRYKDSLFYYNHGQAVEGGSKSKRKVSNRLCRDYNATVAALLFSDAKQLSDIGGKFTWIDFDGELDSLQLAISDPESRIRTSEASPSNPQCNIDNYLQAISFDMLGDAGDASRHVELEFVPGYNGVVGSRGSGKSLLAHLLTGENLDPYKMIVDACSVRYKTIGGMESTACPRFLYLSQGALENIFVNGDYSSIPMLNQLVSVQRNDSRQRSKEAAAKIDNLLDLQKDLLDTFMAKYPGGLSYIDFLNEPEPSGISLPSPEPFAVGDRKKVADAKDRVSDFGVAVKESSAKLVDLDLTPVFPEDKRLMAALLEEASGIKEDCEALLLRVKRFCCAADQADICFENREWLIAKFGELISETNRRDNSSMRTDYLKRRDVAVGFLRDLLNLRTGLRDIDAAIDTLREDELRPIPDTPFEIDGQKRIVVKFAISDEDTYREHASELIKGNERSSADVLVLTCLRQSEIARVKELYNGNKFRRASGKASVYLSKYYDLLKTGLHKAGDLSTEIELDGKALSDMSPGTRADALLQMFLSSTAKGDNLCYIVLDQPEDNLDVKTISGFLVDRLKALKLDVQLFVVSHSAPVIVNGDARLIVACEEKDGRIAYRTGTLSDDAIKQTVATVLDGGERYLKMRLNKYNFQLGDDR